MFTASLTGIAMFFAQLLSPGAQWVANCDPCSIVLKQGAPTADFRFEFQDGPEGRSVKEIVVSRNGQELQRLSVPEMTPRGPGESFFFGGVDINFDGWQDLLLMTQQGATNAKAQYWLYNPAKDRFTSLGEFPMFSLNTRLKQLSTYESNGPAGLSFDRRIYTIENYQLVLLTRDVQAPATRHGWYEHTVSKRINGKLVIVKRQEIKIAGPK
jgi:hypothetical protein